LQSFNSSFKKAVDIYTRLLKNSSEIIMTEEEPTASKNLCEVNQSFSVAVGKSLRSPEVASQLGVIYKTLNTRLGAVSI
jgi:hypothetical protein